RVRENSAEIVLKDASHTELVIPKDKMAHKTYKPVSLMPAGLTATLTSGEFLDLVRFLSELGKPGPYANNPKPLVRRWRMAETHDSTNWAPAYSYVNGDFVPHLANDKSAQSVRCDVEVTTPGKIGLRLNSADGLKLFVDDKPQAIEKAVTLD